MYFYYLGGAALVAIAIGMIWDSSTLLSRTCEALFRKFPRTGEFTFGAMFGFYLGVVPAIVAYAVIHRLWAAGVVDGFVGARVRGNGSRRVSESKAPAEAKNPRRQTGGEECAPAGLEPLANSGGRHWVRNAGKSVQ